MPCPSTAPHRRYVAPGSDSHEARGRPRRPAAGSRRRDRPGGRPVGARARRVRQQTALAESTVGPLSLLSVLEDERNAAAVYAMGQEEAVSLPVEDNAEARARVDAAISAFRAEINDPRRQHRPGLRTALDQLDQLDGLRATIDAVPDDERSLANIEVVTATFDGYSAIMDSFFDANKRVALAIDDPELRRAAELTDLSARQTDLLARLVRDLLLAAVGGDAPDGLRQPSEIASVSRLLGQLRSNEQLIRTKATGEFEPLADALFADESVQRFPELVDSAIATGEVPLDEVLTHSAGEDPETFGYTVFRRADRRPDGHRRRPRGRRRRPPADIRHPGRRRRGGGRRGDVVGVAVDHQAVAVPDPPGQGDGRTPPPRRRPRHPRNPPRRRRRHAHHRTRPRPHPRRSRRRRRRPQHRPGHRPRPRRRTSRPPPQHRRQLRQPRPPQPEPPRPPTRLHHRTRNQRSRPRHPRQPLPPRPPRHPHAPQRREPPRPRRHRTTPQMGRPRPPHRRHPRRPRRSRGLPTRHRPRRRTRHHPRLRRRRPRPPPRRTHRKRPRLLTPRPNRRHPRPQPPTPPPPRHPGYTLAIIDSGLGMPPTDVNAANRRLAGAESFTIAPSKYLGHYVAGNLAARHNIHVHLDNSPGNGITATIDIPPTLLTTDEQFPEPFTPSHGTAALPPITGTGLSPVLAPPEPEPPPCGRPPWRSGTLRPGARPARPAAGPAIPPPPVRASAAPRAGWSSESPGSGQHDRRRRRAVGRPARRSEPPHRQPAAGPRATAPSAGPHRPLGAAGAGVPDRAPLALGRRRPTCPAARPPRPLLAPRPGVVPPDPGPPAPPPWASRVAAAPRPPSRRCGQAAPAGPRPGRRRRVPARPSQGGITSGGLTRRVRAPGSTTEPLLLRRPGGPRAGGPPGRQRRRRPNGRRSSAARPTTSTAS